MKITTTLTSGKKIVQDHDEKKKGVQAAHLDAEHIVKNGISEVTGKGKNKATTFYGPDKIKGVTVK